MSERKTWIDRPILSNLRKAAGGPVLIDMDVSNVTAPWVISGAITDLF
jgi:hypothetical protein